MIFDRKQMEDTCKELGIELTNSFEYFAIKGRELSELDINNIFDEDECIITSQKKPKYHMSINQLNLRIDIPILARNSAMESFENNDLKNSCNFATHKSSSVTLQSQASIKNIKNAA